MPFDDQLFPVLDGIRKTIHEHLDDDFRTLAQQLGRVAAELGEAGRSDAAEEQGRATDTTPGQQIVTGIASIDEGRSLGDVLERLTHAAAAYASRTATLLVRDGALIEWRRVGFASQVPPGEMRVQDAGFVGAVVSSGRSADNGNGALPPFAADGTHHAAVAFPVTVGGGIVAVLYCDTAKEGDEIASWMPAVEVLAKYAGRVLEAMTVQQATGLWPPSSVA